MESINSSCFTCMTIAGSDSSGGAGIQADIKTISALGVFATSVITAITAQNTVQVLSIVDIPPTVIREQIKAILSDIRTDCIKIGMLHSSETICAVFEEIKDANIPIVLDPVMIAKGGSILLQTSAIDALKANLKYVTLITPNIPEAVTLTNMNITSVGDMKLVAKQIFTKFGTKNVLVKGGHLEGVATLTDILFDGEKFHEFESPKVVSNNTHGSGCTFASAIAAHIARGSDVTTAVKDAHDYVAGAIKHADELHVGHGHGPLNHFWHTSCRPALRYTQTVTDYLWTASQPLYEKIKSHGFVQGLLDGSLDRDSFQFFLQQDKQFLNAFDECLGVIVSKTPSNHRKELQAILEAGSNEKELVSQLSNKYASSSDSLLNGQIAPNNQLYQSFLKSVVREQPYLIGLASVLACFLLYNKIGHYLRDNNAHPTYSSWIDYYNGAEFSASITNLVNFIDKVSTEISPAERGSMLDYFKTAMKMEYLFWDMSLQQQSWP